MIRNRIICLIWVSCTMIIFSGCERWEDIKSIIGCRERYEQIASERDQYWADLAARKKDADTCKENLNQALAKIDEYKHSWDEASNRASEFSVNLKEALANEAEFKRKFEMKKVEADMANAEVLSYEERIKALEKRLAAIELDNQKSKLIIMGLKSQLTQCREDTGEM